MPQYGIAETIAAQPAPRQPTEALTEFQLFPLLPVDLQMMIWEAAPIVRRSILITEHGLQPVTGNREREHHVLLHVCRLSRYMAGKYLKCTWRVKQHNPRPGVYKYTYKRFWVDPRNDVFRLQWPDHQTRQILKRASLEDAERTAKRLFRDLLSMTVDTTIVKTLVIQTETRLSTYVRDERNGKQSWPDKIRLLFPNAELILFLPLSWPIRSEAVEKMITALDRSSEKAEHSNSFVVGHLRTIIALNRIGEGAYFATIESIQGLRALALGGRGRHEGRVLPRIVMYP